MARSKYPGTLRAEESWTCRRRGRTQITDSVVFSASGRQQRARSLAARTVGAPSAPVAEMSGAPRRTRTDWCKCPFGDDCGRGERKVVQSTTEKDRENTHYRLMCCRPAETGSGVVFVPVAPLGENLRKLS